MLGANFVKLDSFGEYLEIGYEESWKKNVVNGTKVDDIYWKIQQLTFLDLKI